MSKDVDFVSSNFQNFKKILRPSASNNKQVTTKKQASSSKTFTIEKSFVPQNKPNDSLAPQLRQLKQFYKRKIEHEKKLKQMYAQGIIQKEDLQPKDRTQKKQEVIKDQSEKVKVDEAGQLRDEKGNLLFVKNQTAQLSINKRIAQNEKIKELNKKQKIKFHDRLSKQFLDRNLVVMTGNKSRIKRSRLGLQFLEKGSYQSVSALASDVKIQQVLNLSDVFKQTDERERQVIRKRSRTTLRYDRQVPAIEWWDKALLNNIESYEAILKDSEINIEQDNFEEKVNALKIENYINIFELTDQVRLQKVGEENASKDQNILMPMYLTKDQKKKLKRKKKKEKLQQKNDMIKLGLIEPEKAKLRIGNMAIVMKNQFVMDPSKIQDEARKQQQQRLNKHLQANQQRKLTKKQRQVKQIRKLKRDSAKQCRRAVFKVGKLDNSSHIFKLNMNAKQLALNGFVIKPKDYHRQIVMVAVEGGAKAIKFYKNLMLNRIKWEQDDGNKCIMVWQGVVENTTLGKWQTHEVGDKSQTVKILKEKGVQFFWDYIAN